MDAQARTRPSQKIELCALFYLQAQAQALWYVPFANVLAAHGLERIVPYAFASSSIAAFVSPLVGGALADRHASPVRVLRWLSAGAGLFLILLFFAIGRGCGPIAVLALLQVQQLFYAPTWGLATAIVLARLREPEREFGAVRVWGTFGWLVAGPILSYCFHADFSTAPGFIAASVWLAVSAFTLILPSGAPIPRPGIRSWRDLLGLDALSLFRNPEHRALLVTAGLLSIPLAAFYPFTVLNLRAAGDLHPAAAMSLGQVGEALCMYALAPLLARFRFKTFLLTGIGFGVARYALFAGDSHICLLLGIALHGFCYTLFFIPTQIYLDRRVDPALRVRAQTLLTLMSSGLGTFAGSLLCGWWRQACSHGAATDWPLFWSVLSAATVSVFFFFAMAFRDTSRLRIPSEAGMLPPASRPMDAAPE